jgi:hypothetical protein
MPFGVIHSGGFLIRLYIRVDEFDQAIEVFSSNLDVSVNP